MKSIGFIDYYLSEWHANNYPQWILQANQALKTDYRVAYAWAELDTSPTDGITSAQWCEKYGAKLCSSLEELCEKSDVLLILAPSDPDRHLPYARTALRYGKPTYIDKTFAPDLREAEEIFALSKQYGAPIFSTSALRYAEELMEMKNTSKLIVTGGGSDLPEYLIHQIEMAVLLLNDTLHSVKVERQGKQCISMIKTQSGKEASLIYAPPMPFTITVESADGSPAYRAIKSDFFKGLIEDILHFYQTATPSFDPAQTLEVMRWRDAILEQY